MLTRLLLIITLVSAPVFAQSTVAGDWIFSQDMFGNLRHRKLTLAAAGDAVSGTIGGQKIEGSITGGSLRLTVRGDEVTDQYTGTVVGDTITGITVRT